MGVKVLLSISEWEQLLVAKTLPNVQYILHGIVGICSLLDSAGLCICIVNKTRNRQHLSIENSFIEPSTYFSPMVFNLLYAPYSKGGYFNFLFGLSTKPCFKRGPVFGVSSKKIKLSSLLSFLVA